MPKVAIAIPTYNAVDYIRECLESVCGQTLQELEIFIVDAYSDDGTREIVAEYASRDERIRLIDDTERSTGYAKNIVIDLATAPFYAIVEPDDYIEKDMLELLYVTATKNNLDVVKCGYDTFIDENGCRFFFPKNVANGMDSYNKVVKPSVNIEAYRWAMYEWLGLYRISFLKKNKIRHNETKGAAFQDIGFWFLGFAYAERVMLIKNIGYHYRIDNPNASVNNTRKIFNTCNEYEFIKNRLYPEKELWKKIKFAFWREYLHSNLTAYKGIDTSLRHKLSSKMHDDVCLAYEKGEIDIGYFNSKEQHALYVLLNSYNQFDKDYDNRVREIASSVKELECKIKDKAVVIYGAGFCGANIQYILRQKGIKITAWADNDEYKQGAKLNGVVVLPPQKCAEKYTDAVWLVANYHVADKMKEDLLQNHEIDAERIILCDAELLRERLL